MNTIARVYELLRQRNMTLYELTRRSGIPYSTIKAAQRRGGQLSVDTIERICGALEIPLHTFFEE